MALLWAHSSKGLVGGVIGLALLGAAGARADTIELANGRRIEGRVLDEDRRSLTIQVEGGSIVLPRTEIVKVHESTAPADELSQKLVETPLDDPDAVEGLAVWARARGLEDRAGHLHELARGVRLEKRFARAEKDAKDSPDPAIYLALAKWTRENGYPYEVQRLALALAEKLSPGAADVRRAREAVDAAERAEALGQPARTSQDAQGDARRADALAARERELAARERNLSERERALRELPAPPAPPVTPPAPGPGVGGGDTGAGGDPSVPGAGDPPAPPQDPPIIIRRAVIRPRPSPTPLAPAPATGSPKGH